MDSATPRWSELDRPPLDVAGLRRSLLLLPNGPCADLTVTASTASTNSDLVARPEAQDWTVLVTEHQQQGRGRLGRTWVTPARAALTFSVLLRPDPVPVGDWSFASLVAGLAVCRVLRRVAGLDAALKWPNDVLVRPLPTGERRKVCGILADFVPGPAPAVVVGVGLNVTMRPEEFPEPDPDALSPTSLRLAGAATTDRNVVLRALLRDFAELDGQWRAGGNGALLPQLRQACATLGQPVRVALPGGEHLEGVAEGLDESGRLLVATGKRTVAVAAGDVLHLRPAEQTPGAAS